MAALDRAPAVAGVIAAFLCFVAPRAHAGDAGLGRWSELIAGASRTFGIPESWISSVMRAESAGRETLGGTPITSPAGAMGLMQIMPQTWGGLRNRYGLGSNPYDAHDNIFAGTAYLSELYRRYGYPNLFAAYNAGPGRLDSYLGRGQALPPETRVYLAKLGVQSDASPAVDRRLFVELIHGGLGRPTAEAGRLFVVLRTGSGSR
jgi:soluble lytic murein transglycosylase-like protein